MRFIWHIHTDKETLVRLSAILHVWAQVESEEMKSIAYEIVEAKIKEFLEAKEWDYSEDLDKLLEWMRENEQ